MGGERLTVRAHHDEHRVRPGAAAFAWRSPSSSCSPAASPEAHKTKVHSNRLAVAATHLSFRRGGRCGRLTHRPKHGKQPTATGMEPASLQSGPTPRISHDQDNSPANRAVMTHWQLIRVTTAANVRLTARSCRTHTPISKFWKTRSGSGELRRAGARDRGPDSGNRHRRGGPTSPGNHGAHFLVARGRRDRQHQKRSTFLYI